MASKTRGGEIAEKNAHPATGSAATSSLLHGEKLKQLHATMVKCRRAQKRLHAAHAAKGRSSGHEAVVAGTVLTFCQMITLPLPCWEGLVNLRR